MDARYARQLILPGFGESAQAALTASRVLVVGAGGLGSAIIPALAAAGVGALTIVDDDVVSESNLARQTMYRQADVGRSKVDVVSALLAASTGLRLRAVAQRLTAQNALELFADADIVIDGSDNLPTRYLVDDAAALTGRPVVWGAVHRYDGQTGVCWAGRGPLYRDLFPVPPAPEDVPSCAEAGVFPTVCTVIGALMANAVLLIASGIGSPQLGRVTLFDGRSGRFREIDYAAVPDRKAVTELVDYDDFCGLRPGGSERTVLDVQTAQRAGDRIQLVDVREPWETELVAFPGALRVPLGELDARRGELDRSLPTVTICHHGTRSERAAQLLRAAGFADVASLRGGIDAWAAEIEPGWVRY